MFGYSIPAIIGGAMILVGSVMAVVTTSLLIRERGRERRGRHASR
ncbi:MAG: hypothetical protein RLZ28_917 [Actinomycetota bacterium]|jgi:hypothetical protein